MQSDEKKFDLGDKILFSLSTEDKLSRAIIGWPSDSQIPGVVVGVTIIAHPEPQPHIHYLYVMADAQGTIQQVKQDDLQPTDDWLEVIDITQKGADKLLKNLQEIVDTCEEAKATIE